MREIKFRAWDKQHNMFDKEQVFITQNGVVCDLTGLGWTLNPYDDWKRYDIQFYTGLKDKNGKEIYEGDIVISKFLKEPFEIYYDEDPVLEDMSNEWIVGFRLPDYRMEVIGNIYETPELLEEK